MARRIGKKEAALQKRWALQDAFHKAHQVCVKNNICIAPDCIVDKSRWAIVVEKRNSDGEVLERISSEDKNPPVYYYSRDEYEIRIMEITCFYAESFG